MAESKKSPMKLALISVYDKTGIDTVAAKLKANGWEIISTGGTAAFLKEKGIDVLEVSDLTEFPEILDGRVKTLHPLIFGPILARPEEKHLDQLQQLGTSKIDLVMVNFYPFEQALEEQERGVDFMVENIDIGGPSMVRAAAKNFKATVVVVDPAEYDEVAEALITDGVNESERRRLAQKAFAYTSFYDSLVCGYLLEDKASYPPYFSLAGRKGQDLRYGENPHQRAALYISDNRSPLAGFEQLQGKTLSFNNILDLSMVYEVLESFQQDDDFCVIVKHQNPCGAALAADQAAAFGAALAGDPVSAFGGIVGFNRPLTGAAAEAMKKIFFEVIVAPDFTPEALAVFKKKKNLRLIKMAPGYRQQIDLKTVPGGFLLQDKDHQLVPVKNMERKTSRKLSAGDKKNVAFGWKMIRFVKSNGIILVRDRQLIGVGAGQMSRVDAVRLSIDKCRTDVAGSALISDAFFPFADSIEAAAEHNIPVVVEPGGSIRDKEVIEAAEKHNISLLFTGMRHFRH